MPFSFPEGRTYSPPRRRKVRLPPFPPLAKTAATPLLLLSPQSRLCGAPFPAVVLLLRISHALSEGDAAPAGAYGQCRTSAEVSTLSTQAQPFPFGNNCGPACENLPPAALSQRWTAHLHRPFSLLRKRNRNRHEQNERSKRRGNVGYMSKGTEIRHRPGNRLCRK